MTHQYATSLYIVFTILLGGAPVLEPPHHAYAACQAHVCREDARQEEVAAVGYVRHTDCEGRQHRPGPGIRDGPEAGIPVSDMPAAARDGSRADP